MYTARFASSQLIIWTNDEDKVASSAANFSRSIFRWVYYNIMYILLLCSLFAVFVIYTQTGRVSLFPFRQSVSLSLAVAIDRAATTYLSFGPVFRRNNILLNSVPMYPLCPAATASRVRDTEQYVRAARRLFNKTYYNRCG
jgi:hypothetical protein